jgi:hypothetical protein
MKSALEKRPRFGLFEVCVFGTMGKVGAVEGCEIARDAGFHLFNPLGDLGRCEGLVAVVDRLEAAAVERHHNPREQVELAAQNYELRKSRADRCDIVTAEIRDGLEVGHQAPGQQHQFAMLRGVSRSGRRLDWARFR